MIEDACGLLFDKFQAAVGYRRPNAGNAHPGIATTAFGTVQRRIGNANGALPVKKGKAVLVQRISGEAYRAGYL